MDGLYDADVLEWSERQARLLRQVADGTPGNEAPDWANIIDEVESVGRSQLNAVQSLLLQALTHELKCRAWPQSSHVTHWRSETRAFRAGATRNYTPSMRQRIDLGSLYKTALDILPETSDGQAPAPLPDACPVTLDDLLAPPGVPLPWGMGNPVP